MARSSIYVGEIAHQSPIPNASRIGNIIVSGLIRGFDPFEDTIDFGRELIPRLRAGAAELDRAQAA